MGRFDKDPEPLKYNIGQKVMGYHEGIGGNFFVAGTIIECEQSTNLFSPNSYKVYGIDIDIGGHLNENEIILFDQELFEKVYSEWKKWVNMHADASETYTKFRQMLAARLEEQRQKEKEIKK